MSQATTDRIKRIPSHSLSTADIAPEHQLEAWQSMVAFVSIEPQRPRQLGFRGKITTWSLGSLALVSAATETSEFTRGSRLLRSDAFDHWTLCVPSSGIMVADEGATVAGSGACQVRALHRVDWGFNSELDALFLVVPRDLCTPHATGLDRLHGTNLPAGAGGLLADYFRSLQRQLPELTVDHLPGLVEATRSMIVACAVPSRTSLEQAMPAIQATQMERAKQFVRDNLLQPDLGAKVLCRSLGMSRSSLYRLFEPLGGVARYIRSARLLEAHRALSTPGNPRPVYTIARELGFDDPSEFSRAFRRQFGYSPTEARSERVAAPRPHRTPEDPVSSLAEVFAALA